MKKIYEILKGVADYDLSFEEFFKLKDRTILVEVIISNWPEKEFFKFRPHIRRRKRGEWYRDAYKKITKSWPSNILKKLGSNRIPIGFQSKMKIFELPKVPMNECINSIKIINIEDMPKKRLRKKREKTFYAVKARFVQQVEGMTKGLQRYEDRIVIVKAFDFKDAERRVLKEFNEYEDTFLCNNAFTMVRWKFEEILDIYDVLEEDIDSKGTEVYSEFKYRRMKPEYEWHPEYVDDE
jgi:hypothetical protein